MERRELTIGELAARTGVSVKTLRYYSDAGLLPPSRRTAANYRVYDTDAVVRVQLVRTLREAGLGVARIRAVLARELSLRDALGLQLAAVEAHLDSLTQIAAALRAALRPGASPTLDPSEHDIRRLCTVTRLSRDEREARLKAFFDEVLDGAPVDETMRKTMIDASRPHLPPAPTPAQLDAWVELWEMLADPAFIAAMKASLARTMTPGFDPVAWRAASDRSVVEAEAALAAGEPPDGAVARDVVERLVQGLAAAMGVVPDAAYRAALVDRTLHQDPRADRYWELMKALHGDAPPPDAPVWPEAAWAWLTAALTAG